MNSIAITLLFIVFTLTNFHVAAVTNGKIEKIQRHPWLVKIDTCAGAIIDANHIVTAAHCVADKTVGLITLRLNNGARLKRAKKIHVHAHYSPWDSSKVKKNDIAIIETSQPIKMDALVAPVQIQLDSSYSNIEITGWGKREDGSYPRRALTIDGLEVLPLPNDTFWDSSENLLLLESDSSSQDFATTFFTGGFMAIAVNPELQKSACRGDSGAPLISTNTGELIGIVAHGSEDCSSQPAFFATNILFHLDWINMIIGKTNL